MEARATTPASVQVRVFAAPDAPAWDRYVHAHLDGSFFHLSGWSRVLEQAFRHAPHYLLAERDGRITGVLPLALVSSVLFGRALISTPFCTYGGVVADDADSQRALEDAACRLAGRLEVDYLELRSRTQTRPEWPSKDLYVTFRRPIVADNAVNMKAIPRKQRAMVRKGIDRKLVSRLDADAASFYDLYSESLRNLGTPVFSRRYVQTLREVFGAACEIQTICHDDAPVASVLNFYFRDEVLPYYGGGGAAARPLAANDFMYWEVMRRAAERGLRVFDFGRSKRGTGSFAFKEHWGFEPTQLWYQYYLVKAAAMPNLSPANDRYRFVIRIWRRLPLWLTHLIGPRLARSLG